MSSEAVVQSSTQPIHEIFTKARDLYEATGVVDYQLLRNVVYRLYKDSGIRHSQLYHEGGSVYLQLGTVARICRDLTTGQIYFEANSHFLEGIPLHSDLTTLCTWFTALAQPHWVGAGFSLKYQALSAREFLKRLGLDKNLEVLGNRSLRPYVQIADEVIDMLFVRALIVITGGKVNVRLGGDFDGMSKDFFKNRAILQKTFWIKGGAHRDLAKSAYKLFWYQLLDPSTRAKLGMLQQGFSTSVRLYNGISRNIQKVDIRLAENQAMTKLAIAVFGPDKGLSDFSLKMLKAKLKVDHGLTNRAWRWLCKQSSAVSVHMAYESGGRFAKIAEVASEFRLEVPLTVLKYLLYRSRESFWEHNEEAQNQQVSKYVLRRLLMEATQNRKGGNLKHFVRGDFQFTIDWLCYLEDWGQIPTKQLTYAWLMQRQTAWHREAASARRGDYCKWTCVFSDVYKASDMAIYPLLDSNALYEEGEALTHCVGDYAWDCFKGQSRIFSVRTLAGVRLATLELRRGKSNAAGWYISQLRGIENADQNEQVWAVAEKFLKEFNSRRKLTSEAKK